MNDIYNKLIKIIPHERVLKDEPMSKHTTFRIGGPADLFVIINNIEELKLVLKLVKEKKINITCIGNGSNTLVKDKGIRGITIKLNLKDIKVREDIIEAGAGVPLPLLAKAACENGLSGLEFAAGIPGTLGGAVYMNAGAHGKEFKDIVLETTYMDEKLELHTIINEEHEFSNRYSRFMNTNDIIISSTVTLDKANKDEIQNRMEEYLKIRRERQPIGDPSAGSVFKRKNDLIPAEIIDKIGLKGYNIGDACISKMHAGFIINKGTATAEDVLKLIEHIKKEVYEKYNIELEEEIRIIGD